MLDVALGELTRCRAHDLLAQQLRLGVEQGHGILQLIAEPEGPAGLIEATASPHAAREGLIDEPAVGEEVEVRVRRLHVDRAERAVPERPDGFERRPRLLGAAEPLDQGARVCEITSRAERERDLARLAVAELDHDLHPEARVERGADATRQAFAQHARRARRRSVAPEQLEAIAADAPVVLAAIEKRDPRCELGIVGVAREQARSLRIELGDHVRCVRLAARTEHEIEHGGHRDPARFSRGVVQLEHHELHGRIDRHVRGQLARDAALGDLEHAVAEPVTRGVRGRRRHR